MLALALTSLVASLGPAPLPAGTIIIGVSTIDGTRTEVEAITPRGEHTRLGSIAHARGKMPKGALDVDHEHGVIHLVTVTPTSDDARTIVETRSLASFEAARVIGSGAVALQAPRIIDMFRGLDPQSAPVVVLREPREGYFDISLDGAALARFDGAWLAPATGDDSVYLAIDVDGTNRVIRLGKDREFHTIATLGRGNFRSLAAAVDTKTGAQRFVVERDKGEAADIIDVATGTVLLSGIRGMDPRALGDGRVVLGAGRKMGAVVVARVADGKLADVVTIDANRAGVATPLAAKTVAGAIVVVAWLNRGASLPGELVRLSVRDGKSESAILAGPEEHAAYEVYGVAP